MKRLLHFLIALQCVILAALPGFTQTKGPVTVEWDRAYGGFRNEFSSFCIPTEDGGFLIGGSSDSRVDGDRSQPNWGRWDFWIVRTDDKGEIIWDRRFGTSSVDRLFCGMQTEDGGFLLGGMSYTDVEEAGDKTVAGRGDSDGWLIKIDANGDKLWDQVYGGPAEDRIIAIASAPGDGYALACSTYSGVGGDKTEELSGESDYWVVRIDGEGGIIWEQTIGGPGADQISDIVAAFDGGFMVFGSSYSNAGGDKSEDIRGEWNHHDFWLIRLDEFGNVVWDKTIGGSCGDYAVRIIRAADRGYLLFGYSCSDPGYEKNSPKIGGINLWLVHVDEQGNIVWERSYGGGVIEFAIDLRLRQDRGIYLLAHSESNVGLHKSENSRGKNDYWLVSLDEQGNYLWDKTYGGNESDLASQLILLDNDELLIAGHSQSQDNGDKSEPLRGGRDYVWDFWVLRLKAHKFMVNKDTVLCREGDVAELRGVVPEAARAFYWEPDSLLDDPASLTPTTSRLDSTTSFTLSAILNETDTLKAMTTVFIHPSDLEFRGILKRDAFNGNANGVLIIKPAKGAPPYEYKVRDQEEWRSHRVFRDLPGGLYVATVKDSSNCEIKRQVRIEN